MVRFRNEPLSSPFEAGALSDEEKEELCRSLLSEFGATHVKSGARGELIHSCVLPFGQHAHGDLHPSASLNYLKLTYNCFSCDNSGGLLWFIGTCRGSSGTDARHWLAQTTGRGTETQGLAALLEYFDSLYRRDEDTTPLPRLSREVLIPWLAIHPYLTEVRGIPEHTLKSFRVGWNSETNRIVIPHFWRGDLVGWQTRRLVADGSLKYQSSPDFPRAETLYNYDAEQKRAIVVESPMSVLSKHHITPEIEATFGASITDRQLRLLTMHRQIVLFMDNDEAGWNATAHLGTVLEPYSIVSVADNPYAADAADLNDATYSECINNAIPFSLWKVPSALIEWKEEHDHQEAR